ncbi:MAG: hypothetical protein DRR42_12875 [Gammaproteobacteria bacterium]|nr:MAG: hypothetical protein DRR42_12875 [Gammaproteobacteria bacterium]
MPTATTTNKIPRPNKPQLRPENSLTMDDEINLLELWKTLIRRRSTVAIITIAFTLLAGAYAFLKPTQHKYNTALEVGSYPVQTEDGRDRRLIESSEHIERKLEQAYIPMARALLGGTNSNTVPRVTLNQASGSPLFILTSQGTTQAHSVIIALHQRILDLLIKDNNKTLQNVIEHQQAELDTKQLAVKTDLLNNNAAQNQLKASVKRLNQREQLLQDQIVAIQQRLNQLQNEADAAIAEAAKNANAVAVLMVSREIAETEHRLWDLRNTLNIDLKSDREELAFKLIKNQSNETKLQASLRELRVGTKLTATAEVPRLTSDKAKGKQKNQLGISQLQDTIQQLEYELTEITPTTALYIAVRKGSPIGPRLITRLLLGFALGLILGVITALVSEATNESSNT